MSFITNMFGSKKPKEDPAKVAQMQKEKKAFEEAKTLENIKASQQKMDQKLDALSNEILTLESVSLHFAYLCPALLPLPTTQLRFTVSNSRSKPNNTSSKETKPRLARC